MATFKATIFKERKREDNTWNVMIRFTHNRKVRYISTTMYVTKKDLTSSYKIKNQKIIDRCDDIIRIYRDKVNRLNLKINDIDIDTVIDYLKTKEEKAGIDFIAFARKWCASHPEIKGIKNYITAINSLCQFFGREHILCSEITVKMLREFEEYLSDKRRAQSLYPTSIIRLFTEAKEYYNDEDNDIIRIKQSITKYKPRQNQTRTHSTADTRHIPHAIFRTYSTRIPMPSRPGTRLLHPLILPNGNELSRPV